MGKEKDELNDIHFDVWALIISTFAATSLLVDFRFRFSNS